MLSRIVTREIMYTTMAVRQLEAVALGYWLVFGLSGVVCLAGLHRARQIAEPDVRRGLVWLLATTGVWALLKVGFLAGPAVVGELLYVVGLSVGFGTVWAWLYFCSAYTGRRYHRDPTLRRLGAGVFLGVVAVKLTNHVHGLYFSLTETTTPFAHLAVTHGSFHWVVTGLSYTLAALGMFMLFELYLDSGYNTRPLAWLTVLIALPVGFDIVAVSTAVLVDFIYAPLGVAAFATGVLFVHERRFLAVQTAGGTDGPVLYLDSRGRVRDYTAAAADLFPALDNALGRPIEAVEPDLEVASGEERIIERKRDGEQRYYLAAATGFKLGQTAGRVVVYSDVTTAERRRRELSRHNQQLEEFSRALTHELRNVIQVIDSRLALALARTDEEGPRESIERASEMTGRMSRLVDDFRSLARYGQTVEELRSLGFGPVVEDAWEYADTGGMDLSIEGAGELDADPGRVRQLLGNAFEFARHNGATTVRVELLAAGFAVVDDGNPPTEDIQGYFAFGEAVPDAESGMKLPNVRAFARVHDWTVDIDTDYREGTRVVVDGVAVRPDDEGVTGAPDTTANATGTPRNSVGSPATTDGG